MSFQNEAQNFTTGHYGLCPFPEVYFKRQIGDLMLLEKTTGLYIMSPEICAGSASI